MKETENSYITQDRFADLLGVKIISSEKGSAVGELEVKDMGLE